MNSDKAKADAAFIEKVKSITIGAGVADGKPFPAIFKCPCGHQVQVTAVLVPVRVSRKAENHEQAFAV